jgi:hypothetical protein
MVRPVCFIGRTEAYGIDHIAGNRSRRLHHRHSSTAKTPKRRNHVRHRRDIVTLPLTSLPSSSPRHVLFYHVTWLDHSASFRPLCRHDPRHMCICIHMHYHHLFARQKTLLLLSLAAPINSAALACFSRPRQRVSHGASTFQPRVSAPNAPCSPGQTSA